MMGYLFWRHSRGIEPGCTLLATYKPGVHEATEVKISLLIFATKRK